MFRVVVLWVHVLCGVGWVGACATFVLAAAASAGEPNQSSAFAVRTALRINRLCVPMAIGIPVTGMGNLLFAAQARGSALPLEFMGILAAKVCLLAIMVFGLLGAWRAAVPVRGESPTGSPPMLREVNVRRIAVMYGLIVGAGIVALGLGLWLSGT